MELTIRQSSGVTIVDLAGRLTTGAPAMALREQVGTLLRQGVRKIVINLAETQMMDSSGLGELDRTFGSAERAGAQIKLLHVRPELRRVMDLAQLTGTFEIFNDEIDALDSFR